MKKQWLTAKQLGNKLRTELYFEKMDAERERINRIRNREVGIHHSAGLYWK